MNSGNEPEQAAVGYGVTSTPVGPVWVAASPRGVCDVALAVASESEYRRRVAGWAPAARRDPGAVEAALRELDEYFAGRLRRFSVPVDLARVTPFTLRVLRAASRIAYGRVSSYGDLARAIGDPAASRAVGGALGRNPVPIIVPCHRVVTHARRLGGFTGGLDCKRALLQLEGHGVTGATPTARLAGG